MKNRLKYGEDRYDPSKAPPGLELPPFHDDPIAAVMSISSYPTKETSIPEATETSIREVARAVIAPGITPPAPGERAQADQAAGQTEAGNDMNEDANENENEDEDDEAASSDAPQIVKRPPKPKPLPKLTIYLHKKVIKAVRQLAVDDDVLVQEILRRALRDYLRKHGHPFKDLSKGS